jgi:hypothetical protein
MRIGLGIGLEIQHKLKQTIECKICRQDISKDNKATIAYAMLFGAERYALCPCCLNEVDKANWTPQYKRKCTMFIKKIRDAAEKDNKI